MKKLYTTPKYKAHQKRRLLKIEKKPRKERLAEERAKRNIKPKKKLKNIIYDTFKSDDKILMGAFEQKYGSTSKEANRNKGLPAVKTNFDGGKIKNLKVLTNNVIFAFRQ